VSRSGEGRTLPGVLSQQSARGEGEGYGSSGSSTLLQIPCDVVIFATGFEATDGEWLQSTADTADTAEQGLHRVGFSHGDALLPLRHIAAEARQVANTIAAAEAPQGA